MSDLPTALDVPAPSGLSDLGGEWDRRVQTELAQIYKHPCSGEIYLSNSQGWALLSWIEGMAILVARTRDRGLLDLAVLALWIVGSSSALDLREVQLVGAVLRRGSICGSVSFTDAVDRVSTQIGPNPLLSELRVLPGSLPPTHEEVRGNDGVEFHRVPSSIDVEELMRRLGEG